ncbi:hypothetical protein MMPV_002288 [Pyropia vietnamensis]
MDASRVTETVSGTIPPPPPVTPARPGVSTRVGGLLAAPGFNPSGPPEDKMDSHYEDVDPVHQIPEHRVGDAILNQVTSWRSYRLADRDPMYTARMAKHMARLSQRMTHSFGGFPRFSGKKPFQVFAFLRRFVKACNDNNVSEGRALYLIGNFLSGDAEARFTRVMPDSAGHVPGRTVSSFPEAVNWFLTNYADPQALNQALADCTRATMTSGETPEAFAQRLRELGEACRNVYEEDRIKMIFIQGLPESIRMDCEVYNLNNQSFTLQQVVTFASGKYRQCQAISKTGQPRPRYYPARPMAGDASDKTRRSLGAPLLAVGEPSTPEIPKDTTPWIGFVDRNPRVLTRPPVRSTSQNRACWLCQASDHIATRCDLVPKELQDRLQAQGLIFAKAVRWTDRHGRGLRREPRTVHNIRVAMLQAVTEALSLEDQAEVESEDDTSQDPEGKGNE